MKKLVFFAVAAMIAATRFASAADMALKAPPPVVAPVAYTWTGCYVGVNGGYANQNTRMEGESISYGGATYPEYYDYGWFNGAGVAGGGQVGCDYQTNSKWVVGVRGMIDATGINQINPYSCEGNCPLDTYEFKTNWFATAVGRIGYLVVPNGLLYANGGAAWKNVSYKNFGCNYEDACWNGSGSGTSFGYEVGVGFEYAFIPNVSAFAEIDYMGFPGSNTNVAYTCSSDCPPSYTTAYRFTHDMLAVLVGLNLRFHP